MRLKHCFKYFLFLILTISIFLPQTVSAQNESDINFEMSCSQTNLKSKDNVSIYIKASNNIQKETLPECKARIVFDSDKLNFKKVAHKNGIKPSNLKINQNGNVLDISYTPNKHGKIQLDESLTELFEIKFDVKGDVGFDDLVVACKIDMSKSIDFMEEFCYKLDDLVLNIQSSHAKDVCKLKSLAPSAGHLSPDFDPTIYEYTIEVGTDEKWLDFEALTVKDNLTVKINRRKLCAAGKSVNINITVSSKNPRAKMVYAVKVNRAAKPEIPKNLKTETKSTEKSKITKEKKNKSKKSTKNKKTPNSNSISKEENSDESDEKITLKDENSSVFSESKSIEAKNNNFKLYVCSVLGVAILATLGYYMFIKFKKRREKINNEQSSG